MRYEEQLADDAETENGEVVEPATTLGFLHTGGRCRCRRRVRECRLHVLRVNVLEDAVGRENVTVACFGPPGLEIHSEERIASDGPGQEVPVRVTAGRLGVHEA